MSSKVSVIIPNYNHAAYLHQRIDTVLKQTLKPFEIIILDDCSTDNSEAIIQSYVSVYPNIQFIKNEINSGSTFAQWNKGVGLAKGDLLWIAESDDTAEINFLETLVSNFYRNEKVVLAYCQSKRINAKGEMTGDWKSFTDDLEEALFKNDFDMNGLDYIESFLIHRNTIPNASAVVFKKSAYTQTGGANKSLRNVGDWLVWLQILTEGQISYSSLLLNNFRYHSESVIAKAVKNEDKTVFKDWYGYDMRCRLIEYLSSKKIKLSKKTQIVNDKYLSIDRGNLGLYNLKNGHFFAGWKLILQASFFPVLQSGFIKKAILIKSNKNS
jgi:glycosyltransferase involved in cell wall biosynthesis